MDKNNVIELERRVIGTDPLTELLKEGVRKWKKRHPSLWAENCECLCFSVFSPLYSSLNACLFEWYLI